MSGHVDEATKESEKGDEHHDEGGELGDPVLLK